MAVSEISLSEGLLESAPTRETESPRSWLRTTLIGIDVVALVLGWIGALVLTGPPDSFASDRRLLGASIAIGVGMLVNRSQGLYLARVCAVRSVEIAKLATSMVAAAVAAVVVGQVLHYPWPVTSAAVGGALGFGFEVVARGRFSRWLRHARIEGRYCRPVVLVGGGRETLGLDGLLTLHPEVGLRAVGEVGSRPQVGHSLPWLGNLDDAVSVMESVGADSALVAASDLTADELNRVTRQLTSAGIHVHLSSGLRGIASRRLRSLPLAREPLFYVELATLSRTQRATKRVIDVGGALALLTVFSPVLAIAALAVKLQDGGPALFRQTRVGLGNRPFRLFKLRTMVPDAESQLVDLTIRNERMGGPLFKLERDPRRTRVGRVLEKTSVDELPQLFNVLRGEMSLVGPRPALPHEVAQFSDELRTRHNVLPGITGLWQVEGREQPAFDLYERLDLYYVENWSVWLDIVIIAGTFRAIVGRVFGS